jgi:hypothetical protein
VKTFYSKFHKSDINPADISKKDSVVEINNLSWMKKFEEDMAGGDLDIPGSELDDDDRKRRWRKNYYSIGGDNQMI